MLKFQSQVPTRKVGDHYLYSLAKIIKRFKGRVVGEKGKKEGEREREEKLKKVQDHLLVEVASLIIFSVR